MQLKKKRKQMHEYNKTEADSYIVNKLVVNSWKRDVRGAGFGKSIKKFKMLCNLTSKLRYLTVFPKVWFQEYLP